MTDAECEAVTLTLTTSELATFRMTFGEDGQGGAPEFRHFAANWGRALEHAFWKFGPKPRTYDREGEPCHQVTVSVPHSTCPAVCVAAIVAGMHSEELLVALGLELIAFQRRASAVGMSVA